MGYALIKLSRERASLPWWLQKGSLQTSDTQLYKQLFI
jgi:hypothetical protein